MKYYGFLAKGCGLKSKILSFILVDSNLIDYFDVREVKVDEPVLLRAVYYNGEKDRIEEDYTCGGNPQIVSEEFKNLVEELDPQAAQFFTAKPINCVTKKKYYVMHVTRAINCLDREHSKFLPGVIPGETESIAVGCVDSSKIPEDVHMFRLEDDTALHYVSAKFVREYRKRKMQGCLFNLRSVT